MHYKNKPNLEDLFVDLEHPNPNINKSAVEKMYSFWPNESRVRLLKNLDNKDITIRRKSIKALSCFYPEIVKQIVSLFLTSEDKVLRLSCLKILVKIAANHDLDNFQSDINHVIDSALNDLSVEVTLTFISLLKQLGSQGKTVLIRLAKDNNILRSKAAITALSEFSDDSITLLFKDLLNNDNLDPIIRESALIALNLCD